MLHINKAINIFFIELNIKITRRLFLKPYRNDVTSKNLMVRKLHFQWYKTHEKMRAIWNGAIGFGLVNIPIKIYSAVQTSKLDLDMLDKSDLSNIRFKRINEKTGKEVKWENIVKGFLKNDQYIVLEDETLKPPYPKKPKYCLLTSLSKKSE